MVVKNMEDFESAFTWMGLRWIYLRGVYAGLQMQITGLKWKHLVHNSHFTIALLVHLSNEIYSKTNKTLLLNQAIIYSPIWKWFCSEFTLHLLIKSLKKTSFYQIYFARGQDWKKWLGGHTLPTCLPTGDVAREKNTGYNCNDNHLDHRHNHHHQA